MATNNSEWYATNNLTLELLVEKKCSRCEKVKNLKKFKTDKRRTDGRSITCRKCYETNPFGRGYKSPEWRENQRKKLTGRNYSLEHRLAISIGHKRAIEQGNHNFKKNEIPHKESGRVNMHYRIWKEKVHELYENKCNKCSSENNLECHHILCFYSYPDLRYDPDNGELLCKSCHVKFHRNEEKKKKIKIA